MELSDPHPLVQVLPDVLLLNPLTVFRCPTERSEVGIEKQRGGFEAPIGSRTAGPRLASALVAPGSPFNSCWREVNQLLENRTGGRI